MNWYERFYKSFPYNHPENFYESKVNSEAWADYLFTIGSMTPGIRQGMQFHINAQRAREMRAMKKNIEKKSGRKIAYEYLNFYGPMFTAYQEGARPTYQEIAGAVNRPHPLTRWI